MRSCSCLCWIIGVGRHSSRPVHPRVYPGCPSAGDEPPHSHLVAGWTYACPPLIYLFARTSSMSGGPCVPCAHAFHALPAARAPALPAPPHPLMRVAAATSASPRPVDPGLPGSAGIPGSTFHTALGPIKLKSSYLGSCYIYIAQVVMW